MTAISPRTFIEQLCEEKAQEQPKTARLLREAINNSFTELGAFVYELIQNADDQVKSKAKKLDEKTISFHLNGTELYVYHHGNPFSEKDVEEICDFANTAGNDKSGNEKQTGYKDVGFKSVFKIASRVDICSDNWRFHFDKSNTRWKKKPDDYTWQLAPFWTENKDLSAMAKKIAAVKGRTTFVFQLEESVEPALISLLEEPQRILFLSKITQVSIKIGDKAPQIIGREDGNKIYVDDRLNSEWVRICEQQVKISRAAKACLSKLGDEQRPKRLEGKTHVALEFCYKNQGGDAFLKTLDSCLYSTLPTKAKSGLPFLVNAPFLLDTSREKLMENDWNVFLIEQIAIRHFEHVESFLIKNPETALDVLATTKIAGVGDKLEKAFHSKMHALFVSRAFIPGQMKSDTFVLHDCTIDPTGFYASLNELVGPEKLAWVRVPAKKILSKSKEIGELQRYRSSSEHFSLPRQLTISDVIKSLPGWMEEEKSGQLCAKILDFFLDHFSEHNVYKPSDKSLFLCTRFVLTEEGNLVSLNELYLPPEKEGFPPFSFLALPIIHADLKTRFKLLNRKMEVPHITITSVIEYCKKHLMEPSQNTKSVSTQLIRALYSLYENELVDDEDLEQLRGIPLLAENQEFSPATHLYWSDAPENHLLSIEYFGGKITHKHLNFLALLGTLEKCKFRFYDKVTVRELRGYSVPYFESYLKHIFRRDNPNRPAKSDTTTAKNEDFIKRFTFFPFIDEVPKNPSLERSFWGEVERRQSKILSQYGTTSYKAYRAQGGEQKQDETYLQYVLQNYRLVTADGKRYKKINELGAPSYKETLLDQAQLPEGISLSKDMEEFLGFGQLNLQGCKAQLDQLSQKEGPVDWGAYKRLMQHLLKIVQEPGKNVPIRASEWKFMASDGSWQKARNLAYWDFCKTPTPQSEKWIDPVFKYASELEEFCRYFSIENGAENWIRDLTKSASTEDESSLRQFFVEKIPSIAHAWADRRHFDHENTFFLSKLDTLVSKLEFLCIPADAEDKFNVPEELKIFVFDEQVYYFQDWIENKDLLPEIVGELLSLGADEIDAIRSPIRKDLRPRQKDKQEQLKQFEKDYKKLGDQPYKGTPPASPGKRELQKTERLSFSLSEDSESDTKDESSSESDTNFPISPGDLKERDRKRKRIRKKGGRKVTAPKAPKPKKEKSRLTNEDAAKVGRWAEEHLFHALTEDYQTKFEDRKIRFFVDSTKEGVRRIQSKNGSNSVEIVWMNAEEESFGPYDIQVTKIKNGKIQIKKIEVKGTKGKNIHFFLSGNEQQELLKDPENYRVWTVTGVGTQDHQRIEHKDLMQEIKNGDLVLLNKSFY